MDPIKSIHSPVTENSVDIRWRWVASFTRWSHWP